VAYLGLIINDKPLIRFKEQNKFKINLKLNTTKISFLFLISGILINNILYNKLQNAIRYYTLQIKCMRKFLDNIPIPLSNIFKVRLSRTSHQNIEEETETSGLESRRLN